MQRLVRSVCDEKKHEFFSKNIAPIYIQSVKNRKLKLSWVARLHAHQGVTDRTSARVANLVARQVQILQRLVRTACDEKT